MLSDVLRNRVRDPRLEKVIVTGVDVSRDLGVANVYFTVLDMAEPSAESIEAAMHSAAGFIRSELARELTVRQVPELRFRFDDSSRRGAAMDALIEDAVARDRRGREQSDEPD